MNRHGTVFAAVAAVGVMVWPGAAAARIPGAEDHLIALSEPGRVDVRPGGTVPVTIGVYPNAHLYEVDGVVLNVAVAGDLVLPRTFTNCWYYTNGDTEGAWCLLDGTMRVGTAYAASPFAVSAARHARADKVADIAVHWDWRGRDADVTAMKGLAERDAGSGRTPVRGSSGSLGLSAASNLVVVDGPPTGVAHVHLVGPPARSPRSPVSQPPRDATPAPGSSTARTGAPAAGLTAAPPGGPAAGSTTAGTGGPPAGPSAELGAAPAGGQFTMVNPEPDDPDPAGGSAAPAAGPVSGSRLAAASENTLAPAIVGTGCFLILAGMMVSLVINRRRRRPAP